MRGFAVLMAGVSLLAASGTAADRDAALALLERAIEAHGGEPGLTRAQTLRRISSGIVSLAGEDVPFTEELTLQLPDRGRWNVETGAGARKARMVIVLNGDWGWQLTGGAAAELSKQRVEEMRDELEVLWLATLVPLKALEKTGAAKLDVLPETKVAEQPAVGVKVSRKGKPDVRLWFDKQTSLLVKLERTAKAAGQAVDKESVFSDHQDTDGVKLPRRQVESIGGKKWSEIKSASFKLLDKVDESVFAKP